MYKVNYINLDIKDGVNFLDRDPLSLSYDPFSRDLLICGDNSSPEYDVIITYAICVLKIPTMIRGNISEQLRKLQRTKLLYIDDPHFLIPGRQPGKLIVIEGPDGIGKSTQIRLLSQRLREEKVEIETLVFPDDNASYGKLIRKILSGDSIDPTSLSNLFSLNRFDRKSLIEFWLWKGKIILSDRYTMSNMAYQISMMFNVNVNLWLEDKVLCVPKPTVTILLLDKPEICFDHMKNRGKPLDIFERKNMTFFIALNESYRWLSREIPNCITLDCNMGTIEDVHDELYKILNHICEKDEI